MNQKDMQNKIDSILKESKKNNELKQKKERKNKGKSVNKYNGTTAKITISVGREKKAELDKVGIVDLINDVQDNLGMINSAKIKLKSDTSYSDDDKPRVEIVDLLENAIHDYIAFDIEKKKPLEFSYAKSRMLEKYNERLEKLDHLCVW